VIRVALFLVLIALIAAGGAWVAERPGEVILVWQGWRVSTSVLVAGVVLLALIVLAVLAWTLLRFFLRSPWRVVEYVEERRQLRAWRAISRGLIAVGTGNLLQAKRSASEARKVLTNEPLALLLSAQAAQLDGDVQRAEVEFRSMLEHEETKLLGLHGLFVEASRRSDAAAAQAFAEQAAQADPGLGWAGDAVIEYRCRRGDWAGALEALDRQIAAKAIGKAAGKRRRAVLMTAQAMALEETDPSRAREFAIEAVRLAPSLTPAVALAGRLQAMAGNVRRGARLMEKAFAASPHPELAEAYAELRPGDTARERLDRMKTLAQKAPADRESLLATARAAIDAQEFEQARTFLAPLTAEPTQRVCLLMAEIEAAELGDHGKAREWTARAVRARRDPAWVADGYVSERWLPISPVSGKLDAFVWTVPPEQVAGPVLEQVAQLAEAAAKASARTPLPPGLGATAIEPVRTRSTSRRTSAARPVIAEPPLPDDPGPDLDRRARPERKRFRLLDWLAGPAP
jgi:HemY protein